MRLLHHLARTGGTLISRCLAVMDGTCFLSEINPLGIGQFNPLRQAADWYGWVDQHEVRKLRHGDVEDLRSAMLHIESRAAERGMNLVVRDWSHLDFVGFPFNRPTMRFSWEEVLDGVASGAGRCATVRHPVDQFRSSRALPVLRNAWDDAAFWRGLRVFAESIQDMPWFRYEDFLAAPGQTLQEICDALDVAYDPQWQSRWAAYTKVTGESIDSTRNSIKPEKRKRIEPGFWSDLRKNEDFFWTLELLGYSVPEPLRRGSIRGCDLPRTGDGAKASDKRVRPPSGHQRWDDAAAQWRQKVEDDANDSTAILRLAESLLWIGETSQAVSQLRTLADRPELPVTIEVPVLLLVCEALELDDRRFDSIVYRRRLTQIAPQHTDNLFQISLLLVGIGEVEEAITYCQRLLDLNPEHSGAAANYLLYLNYSDRHSTAEIAKEHFRLGMRLSDRAERIEKRIRTINERIRIGYLASDFYTHPVGKIMLPILESHDRERFDIRVFHGGKKSDALTRAIQATVDELTVIHQWPDDQVVQTIRHQGIDVMVDLGGYTGGGNRLRALSRRVAPIQASFLGYPNTSALPTIDYHLTDRLADPPGLADRYYGERLVRLHHAHVAWRPYGIAAEIIASPSPRPTLGVFNNVAKISLRAIKSYAEILRRVPDAKLVFKYGDRFGVDVLQDRYRREFATHGILPNRLEFRSRSETLRGHLQTMANVDLALDSFPYQGTMTSLECLSVGTPILSCCGDFYAHRATSAMMLKLGLQELVAESAAEYIEIAVELLHHLDDLRSLRNRVHESFYESELTDPLGLARELESTYAKWASTDLMI